MRGLVARLWSPTGLVLVLLCFLMPFLAVRCELREPDGPEVGAIVYTFSGADLVSGARGDLTWRSVDELDPAATHTLEQDDYVGREMAPPTIAIDRQPLAILTLVLVTVALAGALVRRANWRSLVVGGGAAYAAVALVATGLQAHREVMARVAELRADYGVELSRLTDSDGGPGLVVRVEWGFLVALGLLLLVAVGNLAYGRRREAGDGEDAADGAADKVPTSPT
ncbi:hypothetical protein Ais01nite_00860 [Asanoa ishikariensis]|uniref:Uncharacterized protein n=1 Tax=Asanoa ishikariensis TaxID=137265 RepID=A0A1H3TPY8_9ACTN|nr:hypothetical protein [Asanoa ishikariensis]GIF62051.1 hypothetical protein Ais01nite_00860 [Asanoa ishikariensis]SDZ51978.1 hypothetical protein SAMN05421684_6136 [Asanoa ishikariensis]